MKKRIIYLGLIGVLFVFASAFVAKGTSKVKKESVPHTNELGLALDTSGHLLIKDYELLKAEIEKLSSEEGLELNIKSITPENEIQISEEISAQTFKIQYFDASDEHILKISFMNTDIVNTPVCLGLGCAANGCLERISPRGRFSCSACNGGLFSFCAQTVVPF